MKKILYIIIVLVLAAIAYVLLGKAGFVPLYHCGTAMGPNGAVHFCEWYAGPLRTY